MRRKNPCRFKCSLKCLNIVGWTVFLLFLLTHRSFQRKFFAMEEGMTLDDVASAIRRGILPFNDPDLIAYTREKLLIHPHRKWLSLTNDHLIMNKSQLGQDLIIDRLLHNRTHGFFLEVGAFDGETYSNTYFFEKTRHWTGLLIEADPNFFEELKPKRDNAYLSNTCLSVTPYAMVMNFTLAGYLGGLDATEYKEHVTGSTLVQCIPIMTYLFALNRFHIDYFSLDVEGVELDVLKQIDFRQVQIDVLSVEYAGYGEEGAIASNRLQAIRDVVLNTTLYHEVTRLGHQDVIFMRKSLST